MPIDMINDKPGPELDINIAVNLMGFIPWLEQRGNYKFVVFRGPGDEEPNRKSQNWENQMDDRDKRIDITEIDRMKHVVARLPEYSTTWNGMQLVVEEMQRRGFWFTLFNSEGRHCAYFEKWSSDFELTGFFKGESETLPHAVCIAATKALEDSQSC